MEALNFNEFARGEVRRANYRLLKEPVHLRATHVPVLDGPGTDAWEDDGGAAAPPPVEVDVAERHRTAVRTNPGRHQRAARLAVPRESIRVVPLVALAPAEVVEARLAGKSEREVKIAELETRIRALLGVARAPDAMNSPNITGIIFFIFLNS